MNRRQFLKIAGGAALGLASPALLPSLGLAASPFTETRLLMGTFVSISLAGVGSRKAGDAMGMAFAEMERLTAIYSRHDPNSPVSELNQTGRAAVPAELAALLQKARLLGQISSNAFNPMVKPMQDLFSRYSNLGGSMRVPQGEWQEARALMDANGLILEGNRVRFAATGMGLTLDGLAKGEIADAASGVLLRMGVENHLINAGGDLLARGSKAPGLPWMVAVENPLGGNPLRVLPLASGQALATSGGGRNFFDAGHEYHHIISPMSGKSPHYYTSVSVLAPTAAEADAMATALSVFPPQEAQWLVAGLPGRACLLAEQGKNTIFSLRWPG